MDSNEILDDMIVSGTNNDRFSASGKNYKFFLDMMIVSITFRVDDGIFRI